MGSNADFRASLKFGLNKFNLYILQAIQLMKDQQAPNKSKKWVDYSDSDSSDEEGHQQTQHHISKHQQKGEEPQPTSKMITYVPSKQETNVELDKLDDLNQDKVQEVWLDVFSQNIDYLQQEMQNLKKKAKKGGDIVMVFAGKEKERYEIKVYINVAYDYIEKGYDNHDYVKVTVASRNFTKRRNDRPPRLRQKQSYKQEKGDKYYDAKDNEKKKYVDKQTGKPPEMTKKASEAGNNERKYTKEEAEKRGQMIGEFRNKQSKVEESETAPEKKVETQKEQNQAKIPEQPQLKKMEKSNKQSESKKSKQVGKNDKKTKVNKVKSLNPFEDMLDM